ncbi:hypothetical protein EG329_011045 [Mollisiaceae sp. DMI_Dod_QoI]|nr:hypothetical protein EG329_011045 [Helotiales sp. DMI_Dod_QoI]
MSRLKSLFFGKSTAIGNPNLKGQSYDKAVARDPPVQGSYPVAGNGPNVLEEIQRSRARRDTERQSSAAPAPIVPRYREEPVERPRTAPNNGQRGSVGSVNHNGSVNGRTRSGFSMKSPPNFFSTSRRNSLRNTVEQPPPVPTAPLPVQHTRPKPPREVQTYQPRRGAEAEQYNGFSPPFARHNRNDSHASHKSHVDLLEAHSNINPSREASRHRAKASGVRNYGEDVADRNMAGREREARLDLNSPEFSYLKTVYSPKRRPALGMEGGHSRTSSALGHVLGHDAGPSDDIQPHHRPAKAASIRSTVTAPRPGGSYPPRTGSPSVYSFSTNGGRDDDRPTNGGPAHDRRGRALSPLSTSSIQESSMRETLRQPGTAPDRGRRPFREPPLVVPSPKQSALPKVFKQSASTPRVASVPENGQSAAVPRVLKEPPPVAPPADLPRAAPPTHERRSSNSSTKQRRRTMSGASQSTFITTNGHTSKGSYSAFPPSSSSSHSSAKSPTSLAQKRAGMLVEERSEPISLEGVVDLNNTVDTDVTTKTLPAVTHEYVTPTRHEIREERITREIHTHDVYHRILPVIETEILPTKHYVPSEDGKGLTEIAESDLHKYTKHSVTGKPNGNWHIVKDGARTQSLTQSIYSHTNIDENDGADSPIIPLARGEPKTRSRRNSRASTISRSKNVLDPILSSKKESMTKEGYPKTEYVWRHPPVFQDAEGRTQPVYISAGLGDLSSPTGYHSDADSTGAEFGAMRQPAKGEEDLLFRDSGYGSAGMLPGLVQKAPVAEYQDTDGDVVGDFGEEINYGRVLNHDEEMRRSEGEATKALRRMKERRRSSLESSGSAASRGKGKAVDVTEVQREQPRVAAPARVQERGDNTATVLEQPTMDAPTREAEFNVSNEHPSRVTETQGLIGGERTGVLRDIFVNWLQLCAVSRLVPREASGQASRAIDKEVAALVDALPRTFDGLISSSGQVEGEGEKVASSGSNGESLSEDVSHDSRDFVSSVPVTAAAGSQSTDEQRLIARLCTYLDEMYAQASPEVRRLGFAGAAAAAAARRVESQSESSPRARFASLRRYRSALNSCPRNYRAEVGACATTPFHHHHRHADQIRDPRSPVPHEPPREARGELQSSHIPYEGRGFGEWWFDDRGRYYEVPVSQRRVDWSRQRSSGFVVPESLTASHSDIDTRQ